MKINTQGVLSKTKSYLSSGSGKDKLTKSKTKAYEKNIDMVIMEFTRMFFDCLPSSISGDVSISWEKMNLGNGNYKVDGTFEDVWRPSLNPQKYPEGAENIILLLNSGYDTGGKRVFGFWKTAGEKIASLPMREGQMFLQDLVADFNHSVGNKYGVYATLNTKYEDVEA